MEATVLLSVKTRSSELVEYVFLGGRKKEEDYRKRKKTLVCWVSDNIGNDNQLLNWLNIP